MSETNESTAAPADASQETNEQGLVPVSEAIRYRKRAQAAEQRLHETQQELQAARSELDEARAGMARLERRQRVDALLTEAGAIDLDAARTLVEHASTEGDASGDAPGDAVDPAAAVAELRRRKPYLFRAAGAPRGGSGVSGVSGVSGGFEASGGGLMAPRLEEVEPTEAAAERAAETGDRRDLLAYLRLRRRG